MYKRFGWDDEVPDQFNGLELNRVFKRGVEVHPMDNLNVATAMTAAGTYDWKRDGRPPMVPEKLFMAVENFQRQQGLKVDGIMNPGGPTQTRLNEVLPARMERPFIMSKRLPPPEPDDPSRGKTWAQVWRERREAGLPAIISTDPHSEGYEGRKATATKAPAPPAGPKSLAHALLDGTYRPTPDPATPLLLRQDAPAKASAPSRMSAAPGPDQQQPSQPSEPLVHPVAMRDPFGIFGGWDPTGDIIRGRRPGVPGRIGPVGGGLGRPPGPGSAQPPIVPPLPLPITPPGGGDPPNRPLGQPQPGVAAPPLPPPFPVPRLDVPAATEWIQDRLRVERRHRPEGNSIVLGDLSPETLDALRQRGIDPARREIVLLDEDLAHLVRDSKQARGQAISDQDAARIPDILARPDAILLDRRNGRLLYVFTPSDPNEARHGSIVVEIDFEGDIRLRPGGQQQYVANRIVTAGLVAHSTLSDANTYEAIQGQLNPRRTP